MNNNIRNSRKYFFHNKVILLPLVFLLFFMINFSEAKNNSKNREQIYLYNIGDSKYVQYNKKNHRFVLSHLGTPFNLVSDKWGNVTLTHEGKYLHSKVFDRKLTKSTRSIFHGINQVFTLSYSGNSMYKLRIKHYCVASNNKILSEEFCKEFSNGKNQYFYIVPKSFYNQHINLQNNMFMGYNNDIGQCMQMAALKAGQRMMNGMGMNNNCSNFNYGQIGNYTGQGDEDMLGQYVNTTGGLGHGKGIGMYSDSSSYKYEQHDNSDISLKQIKDIKNTINKLCSKINDKNHDYSEGSNYTNMLGNKGHMKRGMGLNGGPGGINDVMRSISQLQQGMPMDPSSCFNVGGGNPFINGLNGGSLNQQCIPMYNNDMYMRGNFNNQYQNRPNPYAYSMSNRSPMSGNINLSSSMSGMPANLSLNQPGISNNCQTNSISNFSNPLNQNMNYMNGTQSQFPNMSSQLSPYSNPSMNSNCMNGTSNSSFPLSMGGGNFNNGANICNDSNMGGPLNLLADPNCMGAINNNGYQNIPSTNHMPGSTMTPMYGANLYPTGQIQMNSPTTMGLGNTSVGYTNVC